MNTAIEETGTAQPAAGKPKATKKSPVGAQGAHIGPKKAKGGKHVVKDLNAPRLVPVIKVLQRLPGPRLFAYRENEQVKTIRARDVNAFLCGMASCKISLKDFRTLRASIGVVKTLARTERSESQRRRKRQIKQAIQLAADDLANTATICRKSYVHGAVLEAFEEGTLTGGAKASSRKRPPEPPSPRPPNRARRSRASGRRSGGLLARSRHVDRCAARG